ncbi:Hypothetical_protein [Hexamita inflata]|uniref:Hypothetical_protein n=1 Tax=Hexamita inflata TaxID=28002 RepID=A0AA86TYJ1_9EUKA|nr:Hypothetical protein HINF_LOCUS20528 [Hexamita inflata]CAI9934555.1 Hypothetical protein HINF_LOCUS22200 [Hexamita inflata]
MQTINPDLQRVIINITRHYLYKSHDIQHDQNNPQKIVSQVFQKTIKYMRSHYLHLLLSYTYDGLYLIVQVIAENYIVRYSHAAQSRIQHDKDESANIYALNICDYHWLSIVDNEEEVQVISGPNELSTCVNEVCSEQNQFQE